MSSKAFCLDVRQGVLYVDDMLCILKMIEETCQSPFIHSFFHSFTVEVDVMEKPSGGC